MTSRPAIVLRNAGVRLAGQLAPGLMIRQLDRIASWTPPPYSVHVSLCFHSSAASSGVATRLGSRSAHLS